MKIAQVAPLFESVPPKLYGGTERVAHFITEELVRQGHSVTLFASGDSTTSAKLVAGAPRAIRLDERKPNEHIWHMLMLEEVFRQASKFDLIHFHLDFLHFPISRRTGVRQLTTLHGRLDIPDLIPLYQEFPEMPVVSISNAQREPLPNLNWIGTVHHGLPKDLFKFHEKPGDYLAFLGRISPEKRVDNAVEIAHGAGLPLKIAAKIDEIDREYHTQTLPLLEQGDVEFIGEISDSEKDTFLGNAKALLFPIDWPEPFGLVMIEALACGTPVVAFRRGSVPEILTPGESGFIVNSIEEAVEAIKNIDGISRRRCRQIFEERFTAERMVKDYLRVYDQSMISRLETGRVAAINS